MSDPSLANVVGQLTEEHARLTAQLEELGFGDGGAGLQYDSNFADSSQVNHERGEAAAIAASVKDALEDVQRALDKVEADTFGVCENCGQRISAERLEAMPTSRLCIGCASK